MRWFLTSAIVMGLAAAQAQETGYAIARTGDTIKLRKSAWIAVDRHPQLLVYKDVSGKKHKAPASNFQAVWLPSAARAFARKDGLHFDARPIPTREGADCWHFVQELYRQDSVRIYRSVHCYRCQRLRLYVQRGEGGRMERIGDHNWKAIAEQHLPRSAAFKRIAAKRNYDVVGLEAAIWRLWKATRASVTAIRQKPVRNRACRNFIVS